MRQPGSVGAVVKNSVNAEKSISIVVRRVDAPSAAEMPRTEKTVSMEGVIVKNHFVIHHIDA